MDSSPPENLFSDREKLLQLLTEGQESAQQLSLTVGKLSGDDKSSVGIHDLVKKVLGSFAESRSIVNRRTVEVGFEKIPANLGTNSPLSNGRKFDDSEESSKSTSAFKERRGCYKRRRTSPTRTSVTPNLIDDGHAWRKYGQKTILNAKHPRNYYRCTHKFDQGCQATKKVQITEEDPPMYQTTYHGSHTCDQSAVKPAQIILDSTIPEDNPNSIFLNFGSTSYPTFPSVKQEYCHNQSASVLDNLFMFPDLTAAFNSSESNHGDVISSSEVYSCTASTHDDSHSFDLDILDVGDLDVSQFYAFDD